ncbi:hypothetical protein AMJ80_00625 [bacterium SM23_31]|nr:MAG: hypothetical protein AMJ80_00625 [bacterium SM23_31]
MSKKIRIFKLAKELNIASDELISFLRDSEYEVRNVNSPIDGEMYDKVMEYFSDERVLAKKKENIRRKRAILRGEVDEKIGEVATDTLEARRKKPVLAKKPAILEAIASLQRAAVISEETPDSVEILKPEEKTGEITVDEFLEKDITEKEVVEEVSEKEKVEKEIEEKEPEAVTEKVDTTEESAPVREQEIDIKEEVPPETIQKEQKEEITEEIVPPEEKSVDVKPGLITVTEKEKAPPELLVEQISDEIGGHEVGDTIATIKLPEEKYTKAKKIKKDERKRHRKLSKKGLGLTDMIREKKQKETFVGVEDEEKPVVKKHKKRKRVRRRKIDIKEVEASIKETLAKMEVPSRIKKHRKKVKEEEVIEESNVVNATEYISVAELAGLMGIETNEVIKKCMQLGLIVSINQRLDMDTITMVADEFGFEIRELKEYDEIGKVTEEDSDNLQNRSPVVTIMGHVDHGKTSLLDYIRESNVVAGEKGGITQHIGAYEVQIGDKSITFLDTPGHEAFTAMRARGAQVTDIVVLVVAADDSVMPQTLEALNHAQAAGVPIIIAINKIDKPAADPEKIKKQLADYKVLVESWGGKYQSVEVSAKTGQGIDDLLETILFQAELQDLKANPKGRTKGVVIESRLEKGRGTVCSVLVQNGSMKVGNHFICGQFYGRVKAMFNERSKKVILAAPSTPVMVLGFSGMPQAGDPLIGMETEKEAKVLSLKRQQLIREQEHRKTLIKSLYDISEQIKLGAIKELLVIIKGDTDGSVEALEDSLLKLSTSEVEVKVIHKSIGAITENDVLLASASQAVIIGFHVRPNIKARDVAVREKVEIQLYDVIYDAISDVKAALEGLLEPEILEEIEAMVEVRESFKIPKVGTIAGCYVVSGKVYRNSRVRLVRDGIAIYDGIIDSLKRFKDDAKEVATGFECGVKLENFSDIKVGDVLETYKTVEVKRILE